MKDFAPCKFKPISVDQIKVGMELTPIVSPNRCIMCEGVAYDEHMTPLPNVHIQSQLKGLHGLDGWLNTKRYPRGLAIDYELEDDVPITYNVVDTFLDGEESYADRTLFHLGYKDHLTWHLDRVVFGKRENPCEFIFHWYLQNEYMIPKIIDHFILVGWIGLMAIDLNLPYGDSNIGVIYFNQMD